MGEPGSYVGRRVTAIVPGTSAGDIRFPPGKIVGFRDHETVWAMRKGKRVPEKGEALIFTVALDSPFRSPLTDSPIVGLLLSLRSPELLEEEMSGNLGPKGSKLLVTALTEAKLLETPGSEPVLDEKNSDHYGPGYLEPG